MNTRPTLTNPHRPLAGLLFALTLLAASSPPAYAEDMYDRRAFARSAASRLKVVAQ